jgi:nucleoside-diphosphate-sugar epimerase
MVRQSGLSATILRPWYVLGPGRRWPLILKPIYWLMEQIPSTRESAQRLGLITLEQVVAALTYSIENPPEGMRTLSVPEIRSKVTR